MYSVLEGTNLVALLTNRLLLDNNFMLFATLTCPCPEDGVQWITEAHVHMLGTPP